MFFPRGRTLNPLRLKDPSTTELSSCLQHARSPTPESQVHCQVKNRGSIPAGNMVVGCGHYGPFKHTQPFFLSPNRSKGVMARM